MLRSFFIASNGTCARGQHVHVTVIFHCFKWRPTFAWLEISAGVRRCHVHFTCSFHSFKFELVLGYCMSKLRSFSMALNWNLSQGNLCANYSHFSWFQIGNYGMTWNVHVTVIFRCCRWENVLKHGMCMLQSFSINSNGNLHQEMTCLCCARFPLRQIATCVRRVHVHVMLIFHGFSLNLCQEMTFAHYGHFIWFQIETCFRESHVHVTLFLYGFKLEPLLLDFMFLLRSYSMASNWKLSQGMVCACSGHPAWIQIGSSFRGWHLYVTVIFCGFKLKPVLGNGTCMSSLFSIA